MTALLPTRRWVISPGFGAGSIAFGTSREDVRSQFAEAPKEVRSEVGRLDYFLTPQVQAFYDETGRLERLKFYEPAILYIGAIEPMGMKWGVALAALDKLAKRYSLAGLEVYRDLGLALAEEDKRVWSAEAFLPDHYDLLLREYCPEFLASLTPTA